MPAMSSRHKYRQDAHFAIVPVITDSFGREVIPSNCIAHGPLSAVLPEKALVDLRAEAQLLRADQAELMAQGREVLTAQQTQAERDDARDAVIADVARKIDELTSRLNEREERELDAARQLQFDEEPIGPPHGFTPADELVPQAPAMNPEPKDPLEFEPVDDDSEGDLPAELELEEPSDPAPEPEPKPAFPQPVAISLNER